MRKNNQYHSVFRKNFEYLIFIIRKITAKIATKSAYKWKTCQNRFVSNKINRSIFSVDKTNFINNLPQILSSIKFDICSLLCCFKIPRKLNDSNEKSEPYISIKLKIGKFHLFLSFFWSLTCQTIYIQI